MKIENVYTNKSGIKNIYNNYSIFNENYYTFLFFIVKIIY